MWDKTLMVFGFGKKNNQLDDEYFSLLLKKIDRIDVDDFEEMS